LEEHCEVDDGLRARVVNDRVAVDDSARVACWKHGHLTLDSDRERLHLLLPSRRELACAVVLLLESWRQGSIPRSVVLPDNAHLARLERNANGHTGRVAD